MIRVVKESKGFDKYMSMIDAEDSSMGLVNLMHKIRDDKYLSQKDVRNLEDIIKKRVRGVTEAVSRRDINMIAGQFAGVRDEDHFRQLLGSLLSISMPLYRKASALWRDSDMSIYEIGEEISDMLFELSSKQKRIN